MAGRPNVYETKVKPHLRAIKALRADGIGYEEIAKFLNVSYKTLYNHRNEFDELLHTIKSGEEVLVNELEATLYDLAKGNVIKTKREIRTFASGEKQITESEERLAPNVAALIFALTNLRPEKWSNKQEVSLDLNDDIAPSFKETLHEES